MKKKTAEGEVETAGAKLKKFAAALAGTCLVLLAGGYAFARFTTTDRPALLIYSLIVAAAVWGVYFFVFDLKKDKIKSGVTALALFIALAASTLIGWSLQIGDAEQKFIEKQAAEAAAAAAKAAREKKAAAVANNVGDKARDMTEYERFENIFINKGEELHAAYVHALDPTGWSKILDSDRLRQDKSLVESRAILQKVKEANAKYRALDLALSDDAVKDIAALKVGEPSRARIMLVFGGTGVYSAAGVGALWDQVDKQVSGYESIFTLLSNKKVTWAAQNGKVLFTEQNDLDLFNNLLTSVRDAAKKVEEMRQEQRAALEISFEEPKPADAKAGAPADAAKAGDAAPPDAAKPGDTKPDAQKVDVPKPDAQKPEQAKK